MKTSKRLRLVGMTLFVVAGLLGGCASVGFEWGKTTLTDKALVFGRMQLERDGERSTISVISTAIVIRNLETADEPGLLLQSFEPDGRFHWALPPGHYQVSLVLNPLADGFKSFAFTLPKAGSAYYFGDLVFAGNKRFDTLGGANIRNVETRISDDFEHAAVRLRHENPQLQGAPVERIALHDMTVPAQRWQVYRDAMQAHPACCTDLAGLKFKDLAPDTKQSFAIGPESQLFDFPEGRSRVLALKLPAAGNGGKLWIRSIVMPSGLPATNRLYIFSPAVMLLDADYRVVAKLEKGLFRPVPTELFPPRWASLEAELDIAKLQPRPRYLVLYTTPGLIADEWLNWRPGIVPVAGGAIPTGIPAPLTMEAAISGDFELALGAR